MTQHQESEQNLKSDDWLREQLAIWGTAAKVATIWNLGERTVQRRVKQLRSQDSPEIASRFDQVRTSVGSSALMDEMRIDGTGSNAISVTADWHCPLHSTEAAKDFVRDAKTYDATRACVIAGDLFNFDALSDFYPKQENAGLEDELEQTSEIVSILLDVFDEVAITKGNHDFRLQKALGFKLRFEHAITAVLQLDKDKLKRVKVTGRDYVLIDTEQGVWRACHTKQYAKQQLVVPSRLADRHQQHIAGGHRHHHAIGRSPSGLWVVELGGLHDGDKTEYLDQWTTDFPLWQNGYLMLHKGEPFCPKLGSPPVSR